MGRIVFASKVVSFWSAAVIFTFGCDWLLRPVLGKVRWLAQRFFLMDPLRAVEGDRVCIAGSDWGGPGAPRPSDNGRCEAVLARPWHRLPRSIVQIPMVGGGARLIGLMSTLLRVRARARRPLSRRWEEADRDDALLGLGPRALEFGRRPRTQPGDRAGRAAGLRLAPGVPRSVEGFRDG